MINEYNELNLRGDGLAGLNFMFSVAWAPAGQQGQNTISDNRTRPIVHTEHGRFVKGDLGFVLGNRRELGPGILTRMGAASDPATVAGGIQNKSTYSASR